MAAATLEIESDAATKAELEDEIRGLKDSAATKNDVYVTMKDHYDSLVAEAKRFDEGDTEAKNNATMEASLKNARALMATA